MNEPEQLPPPAKPPRKIKKTECPISRTRFKQFAAPLVLTLPAHPNGQRVVMDVKQFASGSFGWYTCDKVNIELDGVVFKCQINFNITVVGSKDAPAGRI